MDKLKYPVLDLQCYMFHISYCRLVVLLLFLASVNGHVAVVQLLAENGAHTSIYKKVAHIYYACAHVSTTTMIVIAL